MQNRHRHARTAGPVVSFSPAGLTGPDGLPMSLAVADAPTPGTHYRESPCKGCALGFLHERSGATGSPADCRPWVRCMAHERPDGRSVVFLKARHSPDGPDRQQ